MNIQLRDELKAKASQINAELDTYYYRQECGLDIDSGQYYKLIAQSNIIEEQIGKLYNEDAIKRADKLIAELHKMVDPFEPGGSQPEVEEMYDPQWEQFITNEEMRRGNA